MGAHLHIGPGSNVDASSTRSKIWISLKNSFLEDIRKYVKGGYKGSNEFVDELVSAAEGKNKDEFNSALDEMYQSLLRAVKEAFEDLGFTGSEEKLEASLGIEGSNRRVRAFSQAVNQSIQIEISIGQKSDSQSPAALRARFSLM